MVGNEMSFSKPVSRRKLSSACTASISVSLPDKASPSSQCRNRTMATPSRVCAAFMPAISAGFFTAFISVIGSAPRDGVPPHLHPGRSACILIDGKTVGSVGEIHPRIAGLYDLPSGAFAFEIDASAITAGLMTDPAYSRFGDFPSVERDIAVVVEDSVEAGRMIGVVQDLAIREVSDVRVFDVYAGAQVGAGRKNVAMSVTYRASDRTLRDDEVSAIHARIVDALNSRFAAVLRG